MIVTSGFTFTALPYTSGCTTPSSNRCHTMMNATQTIVAVGKLTGNVASATTIAPSVAPTSGMRSKKPTTNPSANA